MASRTVTASSSLSSNASLKTSKLSNGCAYLEMEIDYIGLSLPLALYLLIFVLHLLVPGRWVNGYVTNKVTKAPLHYRLNGIGVFAVTILLYVLACRNGILAWDAFYVHRWSMAASACAIGLLFSFVIVFSAPRQRQATTLMEDLYFGRFENPQLMGGYLDAKMCLYLLGAVLLQLNVFSYAFHHILLHQSSPSAGVFLYVGLFTFFLVEYLFFEEVHLYTYDFFAERVGFKLGWGCLLFYPFYYNVGLWSCADQPNPHTPPALLVLYACIFVLGWSLSRGANMQKFFFKTRPTKALLGMLAPASISAPDGRRLLVSGFWGLSRHINYLGEILMASGIALSLGYPLSIGPWLYPLYYVAMLLPRQAEDDKRCAAKYGVLWQEYCRRVPYKIVPLVY